MVEPGLEKIQTWLTPKSCSIPLDHHLPGLLNFHKATLMLQEQLCEGLHSKFNVSDMRTDWYLSYPWPCTLSLTFSLNSFLTLAIFLVPVLHYSQLNWYSYSSFFSFSSQFQIIPKSCLLLSPMTLKDDIFVQYSLNAHDVPNYKRLKLCEFIAQDRGQVQTEKWETLSLALTSTCYLKKSLQPSLTLPEDSWR